MASEDWYPHPGQQTKFLSSPAFEALFGGAAGPGKTECLVREPLRQIWHPLYTAIILRRTFKNLGLARGVIQRSLECYPAYGGIYNSQEHYWRFPSGARIYFGHMQHTKDMLDYQTSEFCGVFWDELTEFEEEQYLYLFTRCRVPGGATEPIRIRGRWYLPLRAYVRGATNPGNLGHRWVKKRFITRDIINCIRYFARVENESGELIDTQVPRDHVNEKGKPDALSRAFYPARLSDNPSADPNYQMRIQATGDSVRIAQLIEGDWDAQYRDGLIYDTWSSTENVTSEAEYNPDLPVYWACDDGYVFGDGPGYINYHPRVVLFVQENTIGGLNIFDEYLATGENHAETLRHLLLPPDGSETEQGFRWHQYRRPEAAYMPSEAALFRGELHKLGITTLNSTHRVSEGIKSVRQLILVDGGMRPLRVHPRCTNVIYEFTEYRSDPKGRADTGEVVPMKLDDHTMDAFRYLAFKRRYFVG